MEKKSRVEPSRRKQSVAGKTMSSKKAVKTAGTKKAAQQSRKSAAPSGKTRVAEAKGKPKAAATRQQESSATGTAPTVKAAGKAGGEAKAKAGAESPAKKTTVKVVRPPRTIEDLLFKRFETAWRGEAVGATRHESAMEAIPEAPPFVSGYDPAETERIRALLFRRFDQALERVAEKEAVPRPKETKISIEDLLFKRFETAWRGEAVGATRHESAMEAIPEAPPFVSGYDPAETERIRALLFRRFDQALERVAEKEAVPRPKETKVSIEDLLFKRFETAWRGEAVGATRRESVMEAMPEAPPFVSGYDPAETERIRALLFRHFDLKVFDREEAARPAAVPVEEEKVIRAHVSPAIDRSIEPPQTGKASRLGLLGLVLLLALLIGASYSNSREYFLKQVDGAVEVWKGRFAPMGSELLFTLKGLRTALPMEAALTEDEVHPVIFGYFQEKADELLNAPQGPDFAQIKAYLNQGTPYAPTPKSRERFDMRLKGIDYLVALHRADVAMLKGTREDLKAAGAYLDRAALYATKPYERELLAQRKKELDGMISALKQAAK